MTTLPTHEDRQARYGRTEKKTLSLTTEAIEAIQAYADTHNLYFSVAVESLSLMGLKGEMAEVYPRYLSSVLERALARQFGRFAKMLSLAVLSAEEANYKADVLLLQMIGHAERLDPEHFMEKLHFSMEPDVQPDAQVRQLRDVIIDDAREWAVARMKQPLAETVALWKVEESNE